MTIVEIDGEDTRIRCIYKMKELSLPDYVILEGIKKSITIIKASILFYDVED